MTIGLQPFFACAVCYGDPESPMTQGLNWAILSMLGCVGFVLTCCAIFFISVRRRARAAKH